MMKFKTVALTSAAMLAMSVAPVRADDDAILVTAERQATAGTKTDTPLIETPQPITIIPAEVFLSQGAINISDTVRYAAGITANPYGRDTRVDGFTVRGINAAQFRDGMADIYSYYASIASDPYNFSRVEVVRGPASVLFGQGSIGGLVNMVSKTPELGKTGGELAATYGSDDRKEFLADVNGELTDTIAVRAVVRARDSGTYVDHVPDDRVFVAPSLSWQITPDTELTLLGLYQDDHGGSTSQFLPIIGTQRDNPNNPEQLPRYLFVGKPGWDRYDGTLVHAGAMLTHHFNDAITLNSKVRMIDSNLTYFTHYTDSYTNPTNPYLDAAGRLIGMYSDGSYARMNVWSTDNNLQFKFNTGDQIEHLLLTGVDYSWNAVKKQGGFGYQVVDLYNIDRDALTIPGLNQYASKESQEQLGFYVQDQIRFMDRVSVVLGARRDRAETLGSGVVDHATTFRAGIIGELALGISPFLSYTESFQPIAGINSAGGAFKPKSGKQYEAGLKWQPDNNTLVTATVFHIKESGRPIDDVSTPTPFDQVQSGQLTTKGFEIEAMRTLPGDIQLIANYGYNTLKVSETPYFDYMPKHNASFWGTKTFALENDMGLRLGAGVRYTGKRESIGPAWTIETGDNTLVDALAEVTKDKWRFTLNATNLFDKKFYASCLSRGDCFVGAPRNLMGTVAYRY